MERLERGVAWLTREKIVFICLLSRFFYECFSSFCKSQWQIGLFINLTLRPSFNNKPDLDVEIAFWIYFCVTILGTGFIVSLVADLFIILSWLFFEVGLRLRRGIILMLGRLYKTGISLLRDTILLRELTSSCFMVGLCLCVFILQSGELGLMGV